MFWSRSMFQFLFAYCICPIMIHMPQRFAPTFGWVMEISTVFEVCSCSSVHITHVYMSKVSACLWPYILLPTRYVMSLPVSQSRVQDTLVMADMLQMTDVKQSCVNFMLAHLDVDNCIGTAASNHDGTISQLVMFF